MNVIVRRFARAQQPRIFSPPDSPPSSPREDAVGALPAFSQPPPSPWPHEACANEPAPLHCFSERSSFGALAAKVALLILALFLSPSLPAAVHEVGVIGLTVGDLDRALEFYTGVLPFTKVSESESPRGAADSLFGLSDTHLRIAQLKLGHEHIALTEHLANKGRPIPTDSRSFDHWFQHIAIVVNDMDRAHDHLRRHKVRHVSTAPQTLPSWNPNAAGIKAFYFRDPEDHVLEIIWFPKGKGDARWQQPTTNLFLGIDHTAIVVSETERSLHFYTNWLGLRVAGESENYGVEQEHLNQVFGARLRITGLRASRGPGIEFIEYITPPGGRPLPADSRANDLLFWTTQLDVTDPGALVPSLQAAEVPFVSRQLDGNYIIRDPDGHALWLQGSPSVGRAVLR